MNISTRQKYLSGNKNTVVKNDIQLHLNLDIVTLTLMCEFIMSDNRNIHRGNLVNLRNMVYMLDETDYENDMERMKRLTFIKRGLDGRLNLNIKNNDILIKHINGGLTDASIIDINTFEDMSNNEVEWLNNMISESIKYATVLNDADKYLDICSRIKTADYGTKGEIAKEFEALVLASQTKFRRSSVTSVNDTIFTLREGLFEDSIRDYHDQLKNPSLKLLCGMKGLNEMTGGFESGRVYMFFGLPGEGKSATLLNLAYQIKKCNKRYQPKDPTKIPCVVLLTMENTVRETVERLFSLACANAYDIVNYTPDEVIHMLRTEGELYLTDTSPIDIVIKYKPDRSVDTSYLYTLYEDLEDEGYETICLIQDYIKRIRSVDKILDIRLELGAVTNEFKNFASVKDIPVITASQLNRDATNHIDEARNTNKADLVRIIGRSNIGESMLMLENADCSFLIAPEMSDGNKFMGFQRIKIRYKAPSGMEHMYQPFVPGNGIKFVEDFDSPMPAFRNTMKATPVVDFGQATRPSSINVIRDATDSPIFRADDERNSFTNIVKNVSKAANSVYITPAYFTDVQYTNSGLIIPAYFE